MKKWCAGFSFLLLTALIILVAAIVARTGVVSIPGFSYLFYHLPQPIYEVEVGPADSYLSLKLDPLLSEDKKNLLFIIDEGTLTFHARRALTMGEDAYFAPNLQVAATPDFLELFGLMQKPFNANVTLRFVPVFEDNQLKMKIISVNVGQLSLPPELTQDRFDDLLGSLTNAFVSAVHPATVSQIDLGQGKIILITELPR